MSFGDKTLLNRMTTLGVGKLTHTKYEALRELRELMLSAQNQICEAVFIADPLTQQYSKKELTNLIYAVGKQIKGLNSGYVQICGFTVRDHQLELQSRYLKKLVGRLRHCDSRIETPGAHGRVFYFVPVEIQDQISQDELAFLANQAKSFSGALAFLRAVLIERKVDGLSENQLLVLDEIHSQALKCYSRPIYGADPEYQCQFFIDYRFVPTSQRDGSRITVADDLNEGAARLLVDENNTQFRHFLEISKAKPRAGRVRLPLSLTRRQIEQLGIDGGNTRFKTFALAIGPDTFSIKGIVQKKPANFAETLDLANQSPGKLDDKHYDELAEAINACTHLIGRDFGYKNTVSLSVIKREKPITPEDIRQLMEIRSMPINKSKETMLDWFSTRGSQESDKAIFEQVFSGRNFLSTIARYCDHIDRLKSQIDGIYNKIERQKGILQGFFGLSSDETIPRDIYTDQAIFRKIHQSFFSLLDEVAHLKAKRRHLYRKIAGVKKSWFGFLANTEIELAKKFNAAIIREDLTVMAPEKESPDYKGRRFNKMINNGSKGIYIRRSSDKCSWDGIPELALPSPYTSQACHRHSRLGVRKGDEFSCLSCSSIRHADLNAAENIARLLTLTVN